VEKTAIQQGDALETPTGSEGTMDENIERTAIGHWTEDDVDGVYVGRGYDEETLLDGLEPGEHGCLGNPYKTKASGGEYGLDESCDKFRQALELVVQKDRDYREYVASLAGETLLCWCQELDAESPRCHAEEIAIVAEQLADE